ncbi:MAG: hypothetical protein LBQ24_02460 [Candidatus Peribacteria bacterium]|jgi:hypothetical protein|nr:hypothetical protein [Candidatus Peribacteria bacterium]
MKTLVAVVLSASSFLVINQALAGRPNLTPEQLAKAREVASKINPPIDFDALLDEADRLGVVCEGKLTIKGNIKTCKYSVETAQSEERIQASKERQAKLREENARLDEQIQTRKERIIKKVNELSDEAERRLSTQR